MTALGAEGWPEHLRPGGLRWSWASARYEETVAFYRDLVGLPAIDEFHASFGEDGTIFGLPDTSVQIEIVRSHGSSSTPDEHDQLVFYLHDAGEVAAATGPLNAAGAPLDPEPHPYWQATGAVVHMDPDGRRVVYVPWIYPVSPG